MMGGRKQKKNKGGRSINGGRWEGIALACLRQSCIDTVKISSQASQPAYTNKQQQEKVKS
jgi:hypothetical protein